ncbi:MAG: CPBP family intramembrane metalloprotease [Clostridia bacterium]|nr:CPBP family intramembrane metalloprotease [Clostridia bacterium]
MIFIDTKKYEYKKTVDAIALGLLLQLSLFSFLPSLVAKLFLLCRNFGLSADSTILRYIYSCADIIVYMAIFLLPALFISKYVPKNDGIVTYSPRLPKRFFEITVTVLGLITVASYVTSIITIIVSNYGIGFREPLIVPPKNTVDVVLTFVSMAITPAVVEEILFRKVILNSLTPYGKKFAILTSAILFSLMHCNPSQFLHAFLAGLFFGWLAIKTGSVLPSMIIHFLNNALAVFYLTLSAFAPTNVYLYVSSAIVWVLMILGLVLFTLLIKDKYFDVKNDADLQDHPNEFNLALSGIRILVVLYLAYTVFLTMKWIYII